MGGEGQTAPTNSGRVVPTSTSPVRLSGMVLGVTTEVC